MPRYPEPQNPGNDPDQGMTKGELLEACNLSGKSFDTLRKAARISGPSHGGLNHVFSYDDVAALIRRAESGHFIDRCADAARAWRTLLAERGVPLDDDR